MTRSFKWTPQAVECYELKSDCSKCSFARLPIESANDGHKACQLYTLFPVLSDKLGEPIITNNYNGRQVLIGKRELNSFSSVHHHLIALFREHRELTVRQIQDLTPVKYSQIEAVLKRGLKNGYIKATKVREYRGHKPFNVNLYYLVDEHLADSEVV